MARFSAFLTAATVLVVDLQNWYEVAAASNTTRIGSSYLAHRGNPIFGINITATRCTVSSSQVLASLRLHELASWLLNLALWANLGLTDDRSTLINTLE